MDIKFKEQLEDLLKKDNRLLDDNNELNVNVIHGLANELDSDLISLLLDSPATKERFFLNVSGVYVFKQNEFKFFLDENKIDNSYTQYVNRIGLSIGGRMLDDISDVVIDFPYKDCVLEGGQSTEEGTVTYFEYDYEEEDYVEKEAKHKEYFFNQVLAADEIDRLFEPKAFSNLSRIKGSSIEPLRSFKRGQSGHISDNLIIKGNNLLALHSLTVQFKERVKLIYVDPPYNTGGDTETFTYNNRFSHSTWMTFMKNRLEIAKVLLRNDGFVAITIDHAELFYIGVLADEIFGRDNRVGIVSVVHKPEGRNQEKFFGTSNEFMLVYAKDKKQANFNKVVLDKELQERFDREDQDGKYRLKNFIRFRDGKYSLRENKPHFYYPVYVSQDLQEFSLEKQDGWHEVFPITDKGVERTWKTTSKSFKKLAKEGKIKAEFENGRLDVYNILREDQVVKTHWVRKEYHAYHYGTRVIEDLLGRKAFSYPKALHAVMDTLKLMTNKNDIILDFHAGSGTTAHATIELNKLDKGNRQYILIEQLNEHIEICIERTQKVLQNEGDIGDVVYLELAKHNQEAIEKINASRSIDELNELFDELYDKYFLNYNVKAKEFKEKVSQEKNFRQLSLDRQKEIFSKMIDFNQLYVNVSDMEDASFKLTREEISLTNEFYQIIG